MSREGGAFGHEHAEALIRALHHRGPDDHGVHLDSDHGLGLVHTRLSILDPSHRGHQPMVDAQSGDVLIFNGEIYNHVALRQRLATMGHVFHSRCDTEVLHRALAQWGMKALVRIRGMYAFAWWCERDATLHLARDPMGIKPLYFWSDACRGSVAFASELRALTVLPGFQTRVDRIALDQFMEFGYTFDTERTILQGVRKLPPGHHFEIRDGRAGPCIRHFTPGLDTAAVDAKSVLETELHDTLDHVVGEHLRADVPVALLLSGGLDSSVLAALAARHTRVHTFSFGFDESTVDERSHARLVASHLGTEHEEVLIRPIDLVDSLDDAVAHFDDLFADWGLVSTRMVYARCRDLGTKVVLVGEGADELFAGYRASFAPGLDTAGPVDWRVFKLYRHYIGRRYGTLFRRYRRRMREHLAEARDDLFSAIRLFETRDQLANNFVMKVDKASMSVGIEARAPYLDERIARIAYQIPAGLLLDGSGVKRLLRSMARRYRLLPDAVVDREKFGASIASHWMDTSHGFRDFAAEVALAEGSWADALGLRPAMTAYFHDNRQGFAFPHPISIFRNIAWRVVLLNLWSRQMGITPGS